MRLKMVSMISVTKFKSNTTVQIVSSLNSFIGGECSSVIILLTTISSEVQPIDNLLIGSRCMGCGSSVFSLEVLVFVAWTANLRASLLSQRLCRNASDCIVSYLSGSCLE